MQGLSLRFISCMEHADKDENAFKFIKQLLMSLLEATPLTTEDVNALSSSVWCKL